MVPSNIRHNVAKELINHLVQWQSSVPRLVVGIEGYSGAGKTKLVREVIAALPATVVHFDEFQISNEDSKTLAATSPSKSDVFVEKYRFDLLKDLIKRFRDGEHSVQLDLIDSDTSSHYQKTFVLDAKLLIIDGIWLSNRDHLPSVFDRIVFLDIDSDVADARRRQREGQEWAADSWEETHPDSYVKQYKLAHDSYMEKYKPKENADLVLSIK